MGKIDKGEVPSRAAERRGIDPRWLRRSSLQLISQMPRTCANTTSARTAWIARLREEVLRLGLTYPDGTSERKYFPNRAGVEWNRLLVAEDAPEIKSATIHEAKGGEYEAVCVVVPPDRGEPHRTDHLLACWQSREDDEGKRVIYVGITRAKQLAVIAIPAACQERLRGILNAAGAIWRVHQV